MTTNYDYFVGIKFQTLLEVRLMINGEKKRLNIPIRIKLLNIEKDN